MKFKTLLLLIVFSGESIRDIVFPVIGQVNYVDDFGFPRDGGKRTHKGNDIFGKKMQPLVAAVDGIITHVPYPEASWGWSVFITDAEEFKVVKGGGGAHTRTFDENGAEAKAKMTYEPWWMGGFDVAAGHLAPDPRSGAK